MSRVIQLSLLLVLGFCYTGYCLDPCLYHLSEIQFNYVETSEGGRNSSKWMLQVGGHVKTASVKHIVDGAATDSYDLTLADFDREDGVKSTAELEEFYRDDDVTSKVKENEWYLICVTSTVTANGKTNTCNRCTLKKACKGVADGTCSTRFINTTVIYRQTTKNQVVVAYFVQDLPLANAVVKSNVFFKPSDRYCASSLYDTPIKTIETTVVPNSIAYVTVDGLKTDELYFVDTDVTIKLKDGKTYELPEYMSADRRVEIRSCGESDKAAVDHSRRRR